LHQTSWEEPLSALVVTGNFLAAMHYEGDLQYVIDKDGEQLDLKNTYDLTVNSMVWDPTLRVLYFQPQDYNGEWFPYTIDSYVIDNSGLFVLNRTQKPLYDFNGMAEPLSISETGKYIADGSGRVSSVFDFNELTDVLSGGNFTDITWLHGNLFSLQTTNIDSSSLIQRWNADFSNNILDSVVVAGKPVGIIPLVSKKQLAVISLVEGQSKITLLSFAENDFDKDGYFDSEDDLPADASEYLDYDSDGLGNISDKDDDNDGVFDTVDAFPLDKAETVDSDNDGIGNNRDLDDDGDSVNDTDDLFPLDPTESTDYDLDGTGDYADLDDDNDGVADIEDAFPFNALETVDTDGDGIGNNEDDDDDNDGVNDTQDYYPEDRTKSSIVAADFLPLNPGSRWIFSNENVFSDGNTNNITANVGEEISFSNQKITPLSFSSGSQFYLKVVNNEVQFFGLYLPELTNIYGTFSGDFQLDKGVNMLASGRNSGLGNVEITPTYGNRSLNWEVNISNVQRELVSTIAGDFDSIRASFSFSGTTDINGGTVSMSYHADFWFVSGIGIVKVDEYSSLSTLARYHIATNEPENGTSVEPLVSEKSEGGSLNWSLLILIIIFGTRNYLKLSK